MWMNKKYKKICALNIFFFQYYHNHKWTKNWNEKKKYIYFSWRWCALNGLWIRSSKSNDPKKKKRVTW